MSFALGLVSHDAKTGTEAVRCVRGGQAITPSHQIFLPFIVHAASGAAKAHLVSHEDANTAMTRIMSIEERDHPLFLYIVTENTHAFAH